MDDSNTIAAVDITLGQRLRKYRKSHGMTLKDLSARTGLDVSTLSRIENGKISLNFKTVLKISEDLSLPIANLIGPVEQDAPVGRRAITRHGEGHVFQRPRWDLETLCDDVIQKSNIFWKMTVKCRSLEEFGEFSSHPGEEFLYVIEGVMELHSKTYKPVRLEAGDSMYFDGMTPHAYIAVSTPPPVVLMSNTLAMNAVGGFEAND